MASYYHCTEAELQDGTLLTGAAARGVGSKWSGVERTHDSSRVYLFVRPDDFEGGDNPKSLAHWDTSNSGREKFVYEVRPNGGLRLDSNSRPWRSFSCESALITTCVHRPPPDS